MTIKDRKLLLIAFSWLLILNTVRCFNLTILHTNDIHARIEQFNAYGSECSEKNAQEGACFGGEARRMTKVAEIRAQRSNVLLLDGGDRFVGTLWFTQYKGLADSFFINRYPYDAMSLSYTYIGLQPKRPQVKMPELTSYGMENNGQYLFIKHMKTIVFISKFNTKVAEIRSKRSNVLLLDGGDRFVGTLSFTQYKGLADSFFINRYPYDAMCLGNHEFDTGVDGLVAFLTNLTVPVVAANVDVTSEPRLQGLFSKHIIKMVDGENIGIVGYTTPETAYISNPGPTVKFDAIIDSLQAEVNALKIQGVNKIIAVGHAGYNMDKKIASNVDGLDIVVGGHTDTFLYTGDPPSNEAAKGPYPTVVDNPSGAKTLVVQDYTWGKYLGELNVVFNDNGEVESHSGNPILLDNSVPEDPATKVYVDRMAAELDALRSELVGESLVTLDGERSSCRLKECNLGNLITDAIIDFHASFEHPNNTWAPAAFAIWNGGGIRASVPIGNITVGNVLEVLPFGNEIDLVTMRGSTILKALEKSVEGWDPIDQSGAFLHFSGLRVTYDLSQPVGSRVASVMVRCLECRIPTYSTLKYNHIYSILTSAFLLGGGDGYTMFTEEILSQERFNSLDADVLRKYIKKLSPIHPSEEERITFVSESTSGASTVIIASPLFMYLVCLFVALLFLGKS